MKDGILVLVSRFRSGPVTGHKHPFRSFLVQVGGGKPRGFPVEVMFEEFASYYSAQKLRSLKYSNIPQSKRSGPVILSYNTLSTQDFVGNGWGQSLSGLQKCCLDMVLT
ncbi:hypothetical protein TWF225_011202 [Orbilia oligospora]|nr:hypothetical protein TWF225_011202 [Orbilia oligospora]KAF3248205.1 hypothetical protein TWF217_009178 [Orbilia oligospora]KAF3250415.1 hypothetical protein TWF128_007560 [Orbilia oligospora]KAF3250416.1 hypothetical protein TWF128_007560 [Orbilia oligospora]KAF3285064.1 hypothetical protein TWF132_009610 [Orbilia oligospora]